MSSSKVQNRILNPRPDQLEVIQAVEKSQDALVVWPTGAGKSLCYQWPALHSEDLTLVVSPLIALMEDQVRHAKANGWPFQCLHSDLSFDEKKRRLKGVADGSIKLLYVTPERFQKPEFWEALSGRRVGLFAVDEAHCVSQWGYDFRPHYTLLGEMAERLGRPPIMALTATANLETQRVILDVLKLKPGTRVFGHTMVRENIQLNVHDLFEFEDKFERLVQLLSAVPTPAIVYFTLISSLEKVSERLKIPHLKYHGNMMARDKKRAHAEFLASGDGLMLATPAYGLGVDKSNIRTIIHFEVPNSVEAYVQEVGRAGRDGVMSDGHLLYASSDLQMQMDLVQNLTPDLEYVRSLWRILVGRMDEVRAGGAEFLNAQMSFKNKRDMRFETALNLFERWGMIKFENRNYKTLEILDQDLGEGSADAKMMNPRGESKNSEEIFANMPDSNIRKRKLMEKLNFLVGYVNDENCRWVYLNQYFGVDDLEPCGRCDVCRG